MAGTRNVQPINALVEILRNLEDKSNGGEHDSERTPLLRKKEKVDLLSSLSDSESSDSEFGDILSEQKPRKRSHHEEKKVTNTGTFMYLLKANAGVGLLAMPKAMSNFGLLAGSIGIVILGSLYIYCIHLLLALTRAMARRVMVDRRKANFIKAVRLYVKTLQRNDRRMRRMKNVAGAGMSNAEEAASHLHAKEWKVKYTADIERGESSAFNKNSEEWEEKFAEDFEIGESSAVKENNLKNAKEKSAKTVQNDGDDKDTDIADMKEKSAKIEEKGIDIDEEQESEGPKNDNIPAKKGKSKKKVAQKRREIEEADATDSENDEISDKKIKYQKKVPQKRREIEEADDTDSEKDDTSDKKIKSQTKIARKGREIEEEGVTDSENDEISDKAIKSQKKIARKGREIEEAESTDSENGEISDVKVKSKKKVDNKGREIEETDATGSGNDEISDGKVKSKKKVAQKGREIEAAEVTDSENEGFLAAMGRKGSEYAISKYKLPPLDDEPILRSLNFPKLVELSFHYGQEEAKWMRKIFKFYTKALLILTHSGCCCVCFLFIAESLSEVAMTGKYFTHGSSFRAVGYAVPIMICLSFIPDRHELTGVTIVAFLLQFIGVAMMLYFFIIGDHSKNIFPYIAPFDTWSLYFGIVFYAFEGTGVTLHLQSHMEKQKDITGKKGILNMSMFILIPLYVVFGALGYWKFGNDVKTSVTFDLPEGPITNLVQIMTALGILLTYPLHFSFVLTPLKKLFIRDEYSDNVKQGLDLVLRSMFVTATFVVSALVPYLELQLSVLGATTSCFLILFLPPFMSLNTYGQLPGMKFSCCQLLFHILLMIIGTAGSVLSAYTTIKNLPLYYPNATIFG